MSNASLFRRMNYEETLMMRAAMPKTAASDDAAKPRVIVERRPAPLKVKLSDLSGLAFNR